MKTSQIWNFPPQPMKGYTLNEACDNILSLLEEGDTVPAVFGGNGGSGFEYVEISDEEDLEAFADMLNRGALDVNPEVADDFAANGIDFSQYEGCIQISQPDGSWAQFLLWDVDPHTYDVQFDSDSDSNSKGWHKTYQDCLDYIAHNNGTNESYFADYKGGTASIVCNETGDAVYSETIR